MEKISTITLLTALSVFLISIFLYWKIMRYNSKKEMGAEMYKQWTSRLYFWQGAIFTGTGVTFLILFLLKWAAVLTF
ncbi:hypothetical protein [Aequorivita antarctica]|uniref:Molybdenum ABC transporter permease n=1 Tax=Aequorivita antarctica TaxID=153266 RepID=A0A5C6YZ24_9FLAO|nr:hypothetical protein [Aequorivita antarctica]TXD72431.1 hypothetical protein ESU54_11480 [Aequorivita antarctica]SRX75558.1 hypothetical protein AEQU3_02554 [Aequorivita antarctica]